jgi:hypothetical protein
MQLLVSYLAKLWGTIRHCLNFAADEQKEHTGPGSSWSETDQDYNMYYDRSRFSLPVELKDPAMMNMFEIFSLAQFFTDTSSLGSPDPFSFRCELFLRSPTPAPVERGAITVEHPEGKLREANTGIAVGQLGGGEEPAKRVRRSESVVSPKPLRGQDL